MKRDLGRTAVVVGAGLAVLALPFLILGGQAASAAGGPPGEAQLAIVHSAAECVLAERFPQLEACVSPAAQVAQVRVFFRTAQDPSYYFVDLKPAGECFAGALPKPSRDLGAFSYYIQALDTALARRATGEFSSKVVADPDQCGERRLTPYLPLASVVVGALTPGGAAVPAGFLLDGVVVAAGAPAAAGTAALKPPTGGVGAASAPAQPVATGPAEAAGKAGAGAAGGGGTAIGKFLLIGGLAAGGAVGAVALSGSKDDSGGGTSSGPISTGPTPPPTVTGTWAFALRCQGRDTNVATATIALNQTSGGQFSGSAPGTDYTGETFTLNISGNYSPSSGSLTGQLNSVFDTGTRIDTFSTTLTSNDTGYLAITCTQNCGCPGEMRLNRIG